MNPSAEYVLDSSALLALFGLEAGHQQVAEVIRSSVVSSVNLAEVTNKLAHETPSADAVRKLIATLELQVVDWTEEMAYDSIEFTPFNKSHGLSLGDRACLTLAKRLHATAVTADRTWRRAPHLGVRVMIFR